MARSELASADQFINKCLRIDVDTTLMFSRPKVPTSPENLYLLWLLINFTCCLFMRVPVLLHSHSRVSYASLQHKSSPVWVVSKH